MAERVGFLALATFRLPDKLTNQDARESSAFLRLVYNGQIRWIHQGE